MQKTSPQVYVAGFLFRGNEVALVRKLKPDWQAGKLNGIGGKVEPGETPYAAMRREFIEEAGADLNTWREFCVLNVGLDAVIHFFTTEHSFCRVFTREEEPVGWYPIEKVLGGKFWDPQTEEDAKVLPNLRWLIPLARDPDMTFAEIKC